MTRAILDVECSLTGRRWEGLSEEAERLGEALAQQTGQPLLIARLLAERGIDAGSVETYLAPSLRDLMPDPSSLRDMDTAAARFVTALDAHERIAVFADYDVDGGASAALLLSWLRAIGRDATLYIPDRIDEGYGPNIPAMQALARDHGLIVCVDCGTLSHDPIAAAKGADVIVLDHHLGGETLPPAVAVVNPNRQDEDGTLSHLCAAGVVFLMLAAVNRLLRGRGEKTPDLLSLLDLVGLATVADVAPLTGLNRAFVRQGLKVLAARRRPGLRALADVAGLSSAPTAWHLGFLLGPRINAGGRIGAADLGARLLATDDEAEAEALATRLDALNTERREIEAQVLAAATAQAETRDADGALVWAAGEGWHPGVVGIVAARLKEAFDRPAVVIGLDGETGKGSGRSVPGIDLGAAVARLTREGLLDKGGGHRMAAGLTVARDRLEPAMQALGELLARQGAAAGSRGTLRLSGLLDPAAATVELIESIEAIGPFGVGNPAPRFAIPAARIASVRRAGESHLQLRLAGATGRPLDAIAFRAFDGPLGAALESAAGGAMHLAGRIEIDTWQGRNRPKLRVEDAAPA